MSGQKSLRAMSSGGYVIFLIALDLFISYVDRGHLATAAPMIEQELGLSATRFIWLLTAFYITYVAGMVPAGWLAELTAAIVYSRWASRCGQWPPCSPGSGDPLRCC